MQTLCTCPRKIGTCDKECPNKMYNHPYIKEANTPTPQPQGFTLQQVSDAWDACEKNIEYYRLSALGGLVGSPPPDKAQYLSTLTPTPDVKEVAVAFSKYCYSQDANIDKLTFDYWYENIYPGLIEQTKK